MLKRILERIPIVKITILFLTIVMLVTMLKIKFWKDDHQILYWDIVSYYAYLPATFIYDDLSLEFKDDYQGEHKFTIWAQRAENGNYVIKTSMGLSYLYAPWFFIGHLVALNTDYDAGGYSIPYKIAMQFGVLIYFLIGLFFLRKVLLRYFNKWIASLAMISVILGTNLYYFIAFETTMPHSYDFALFSGFLWFVIRWYDTKKLKFTILIGLFSGLIALIRPTNVIVLIIFLLWNVKSFHDFVDRIKMFLKDYKKILIMMLAFLIIWIPQLLYWKYMSGDWFYYSYGDEGFFFLNPKIFKSLFSYRSGWLVYSPIMLFSLLGFFNMRKNKLKEAFLPILVFSIINMWVLFSWWCWWWGGSLGLRPLTDSYAFLAIPFAAFLQFIYGKRGLFLKLSFSLLFLLMLFYGYVQNLKYYKHSIHYDGMTKEAFWYNFNRIHIKSGFWDLIERPNYNNAKLGLDESAPDPAMSSVDLYSMIYNSKSMSLAFFDPVNMKNKLVVKNDNFILTGYEQIFYRSFEGDKFVYIQDTALSFSGEMRKTNLLINIDAKRLLSEKEYEISFWYYNPGNRMDAYFYVNQIDSEGNQKWSNYHNVKKWSENYGDWSLVKAYFTKSKNTSKIEISFFYQNEYNTIAFYNNILVRSLDIDVYLKMSDGSLYKNNQAVILKEL